MGCAAGREEDFSLLDEWMVLRYGRCFWAMAGEEVR